MKRILLIALCLSSLTSCISARGGDPRLLSAPECKLGRDVAGTWRSFRSSQMGPAWMTVTLGCDCTYRTAVQLLWLRVVEEGVANYHGDEIVFTRKSGSETRWPYRLQGGRLLLTESPTEEHGYRRVRHADCHDRK
jgi:hypothetical protein